MRRAKQSKCFAKTVSAQPSGSISKKRQHCVNFPKEFELPRRDRFGAFIDGLNRLPIPAMAFGVIGMFVAAMTDPIWFASRMQGVALVPEPLWWLLGAVVSFHFGTRKQSKGQEFQKNMASVMAVTPQVIGNLQRLSEMRESNEKTLLTQDQTLH